MFRPGLPSGADRVKAPALEPCEWGSWGAFALARYLV